MNFVSTFRKTFRRGALAVSAGLTLALCRRRSAHQRNGWHDSGHSGKACCRASRTGDRC